MTHSSFGHRGSGAFLFSEIAGAIAGLMRCRGQAEARNPKGKFAGLTESQRMTPETSAEAALKWLHYKGHVRDKKWVPYQGPYEALRNYNAAAGSINGIPSADDYANTVMNNAWASYGDWQK